MSRKPKHWFNPHFYHNSSALFKACQLTHRQWIQSNYSAKFVSIWCHSLFSSVEVTAKHWNTNISSIDNPIEEEHFPNPPKLKKALVHILEMGVMVDASKYDFK